MSENIQHQFYSQRSKEAFNEVILDSREQAHELAVDLSKFGAAAVASEVEASFITGTPTEVSLPNPVTQKMLRRGLKIDMSGEGNTFSWDQDRTAARADEAVTSTIATLERLAMGDPSKSITIASAEVPEELPDRIYSIWETPPSPKPSGTTEVSEYITKKLEPLSHLSLHANDAMILDGAEMPKIFSEARYKAAASKGLDPRMMGFNQWQHLSTPEQRLNFAQWYKERLVVLADPEKREEFTENLKTDYMDSVRAAMTDGWIDSRHTKTLEKRMDALKVRYFSPFGSVAGSFGGANQEGSKTVALPTITGPMIVTHEFGHSFAGVEAKSMSKYFTAKLGKLESQNQSDNLVDMYTILNEGFNEHMTVALLRGTPEVISPAERKAKEIFELPGTSILYESYREVFGVLVEGSERSLDTTTMSTVIDSMVEGDFKKFAELVTDRWDGRDVIGEMLTVIADYNDSTERGAQDPEVLSAKIVSRLQNPVRSISPDVIEYN